MVLGEDDAHGTSRVTRVGPPVGLDTLIVPSKAASRRATPRIPVPRHRVGAAPRRRHRRPPGGGRPRGPARPRRARPRRACRRSPGTRRRRSRPPTRPGPASRSGREPLTATGNARSSDSASIASRRPRSASTGGWIPRTTSRRSPRAAPVVCRASSMIRRASSRVAVEQVRGHPERQPEPDQPRLRAVVQVALDPAQLGGRVVERLVARLGQHLDPLLEPLRRPERQQRPVQPAARDHDRADAVPPGDAGDDGHEQGQHDQRQRERQRHRQQQPGLVAPGHRVGGPDPQALHRARVADRTVRRRHRRAEHVRRHPTVEVGEPTGGRQGQQQQRDPDHDHDQRAGDRVEDEERQGGHRQQHLRGGVPRHPQASDTGHGPSLPDPVGDRQWCWHHPGAGYSRP